MKFLCPLIVCFFFSTEIIAQPLRRSVYNFEIGDYYSVSHYWHTSSGFTVTHQYDLFEITEKNYNSDSTFVTYTANRQVYIPPLPGSPDPSLTSDVISFSHTNLGSLYSVFDTDMPFGILLDTHILSGPDPDSCLILDTLSNVYECQNVSLQTYSFGMSATEFPPCFEPITSDYFVREGCGGPYGGFAQYGDPSAEYGGINLIYFNKAGVGCGSLPSYFVGQEELTKVSIEVFPNPIIDFLELVSYTDIVTCDVFSIDGQQTKAPIVNTKPLVIDMRHVPPGSYIVRLVTSDNILYKRIEKQ
jgi:hypothetical protein